MLRSILSVIAGYVAMFIVVFASFTAAMFIISVDSTYKPGSWDVSNLWLIISFVLGLVAAIVGGWVCAKIAKSGTPPKVLAALALVLGGLMSAMAIYAPAPVEAPPARTADVSPFDAMQYSKAPTISHVLNPIIGAVGVLIGAALVKRRSPG